MGKVLVTGFEPFGGEAVNPSWQAARTLHGKVIGGHQVVAMEIPTVFGKAARTIEQAIREIDPVVVLSIGQAGGAFAMKVERFALNLDDARIADNEGNTPVDAPIAPDGPAGYLATIPAKKVVDAIRAGGIPAVISYSAGTYVCNHLFFSAAHYVASNKLKAKVGFIHVPFLPEQVVEKSNVPSMSAETIARAVEIAVEACLAATDGEAADTSAAAYVTA